MATVPDFISIDPEKDKRELIEKYEQETGSTLYNAQDAMILINLMVYYANLVKTQFNDAAKLNLVESSRYPILDFLGKYKKCIRISAHKGEDRLQVKLNTTFSYDITIARGFQCKTNDGKYVFETLQDLIIPAGENIGIVKIESLDATEELNKYKAGEISIVISSAYSFIENITNLDGVSGASDDEDDEHYIERILLSPEGFSVAGPELAYIYFMKSAHSSIIDAAVDTPQEDISVKINNNITTITESGIRNLDNADIETDYQEETVTITLKEELMEGSIIKVKIPHPYKINGYILTDDGKATQTILDTVAEKLKDVRPMADYFIPKSAGVKTYTIAGTVYVNENTDIEIVKQNVNAALEKFIGEHKNRLKTAIVVHQIVKTICNIEGVYDFKPTKTLKTLEASKYIAYKGSIGTLNYERVEVL